MPLSMPPLSAAPALPCPLPQFDARILAPPQLNYMNSQGRPLVVTVTKDGRCDMGKVGIRGGGRRL